MVDYSPVDKESKDRIRNSAYITDNMFVKLIDGTHSAGSKEALYFLAVTLDNYDIEYVANGLKAISRFVNPYPKRG